MVGLLLLAGAVVNVLVAWACAARSSTGAWLTHGTFTLDGIMPAPPAAITTYRLDRVPTAWARAPGSIHHGGPSIWIGTASGFGIERTRVDGQTNRYERPPWLGCFEDVACGFPLRCLDAERVSVDPAFRDPDTPPNGLYRGRVLPRSWGTLSVPPFAGRPFARVLPLGVRPVEFAVSTALYAALLAVPYWSRFLTRRWWRARRGLCPGCGYDARGLAVCPECGTQRDAPSPRTHGRGLPSSP